MLCGAFIVFYALPTRMDPDKRRAIVSSESFDVLVLYDGDIYILCAWFNVHLQGGLISRRMLLCGVVLRFARRLPMLCACDLQTRGTSL